MYNLKNKTKKKEKHPSHVLSNLSLPVTTIVLVGEAFKISLHMDAITIKILKKVTYIYLENEKFLLPPFHQYQMYFVQY